MIRRHRSWLACSLVLVACPSDDGPINETITGTGTGGADTGGGPGGPGTADETADESGGGGFPGDPFTFYIEETTDFTNSGLAACQNTDLNQVGDWLVVAFEDHGFTGTYTLNEDGTPYNFIDAMSPDGNPLGSPGLDDATSDLQRVSIYAGHGNVNRLQWGNPGPPGTNLCGVSINDQTRLGTLGGDTSGFAMYVTSCTANTFNDNLLDTLGQSQVGQHVGWHNSPAVSDQMPGAFVNQTATSIIDGDVSVPVTNRDAWLGLAQSKPGLGENSPVIYTPGATAEEVVDRHFNARLALGIGIEDEIPEPQDPDLFNLSWVDNGDCP